MKISVITPSYQNSEWLKRCVSSVADQGSALQEHIVQDAGSTDGTRGWLEKDPRVKAWFEKDAGMYDAINRGFSRASGDIIGYLNCDEQYLPGALQSVANYFAHHPVVDAVVGDTVVVDAEARYLCSRLGVVPGFLGTWVRFPVVTSSFFFRRKCWETGKLRFDTSWKIFGDLFFVLEMIRQGIRFGVLPEYLSAFFDHGENLYLRADPQEIRRRRQTVPLPARLLAWLFFLSYWVRVFLRQGLRPQPLSYAIYFPGESSRRSIRTNHPSFFWAGRSRWRSKPPPASNLEPAA